VEIGPDGSAPAGFAFDRYVEAMTKTATSPLTEQRRLALIYQISRELSSRLTLSELLPRVLQETVKSIEAHNGSLIVLDDQNQVLYSALMLAGKLQPDPDKQLASFLQDGLAGWVLRHQQPVLVPNTTQDPRWRQAVDDEIAMAKSAICVPLPGRERLVGLLTMVKSPVEALNAADLSLLIAIADQAGIAIENAQLFDSERRRREISTILGEVARIINSTLNMEQVLPLILEQLARVLGYDSASILLREGGRLRVAAARGYKDPAAVLKLTFDARAGHAAQVVRDKRCLVIPDVSNASGWVAIGLPDSDPIHSWIGAPLVVKDEAIGLLSLNCGQINAYSNADGQVAASFAEQAATAVVNARLYAESERRAQAMRVLASTTQIITATLDLDEVLRRLAQQTRDLLRVDAASIGLLADKQLVYREAAGGSPESIKGTVLQLGQGIAGWVAQHNEPVVVPDTLVDARFYPGIDQQTGYRTHAIACAPIRLQDQVIGVIEVLNPVGGVFETETLNLLDSLASLAGTAIAHAQKVTELQAAENRFSSLFEHSIDPILITNLNGIITDANRTAVDFFGYGREELIGLKVTTVHRIGTAFLGSDRFQQLRGGEEINYQTRITTKSGTEIPVEVHAKVIRRAAQEFIQWIQHDLSERLALEEMRSDMISMIFHDLRSPLGNILSSLDVAQASLPAESEMVQSLLAIASRSAARLSRLVDSLLDLRRLEAGQVVLNKSQSDINTLVVEATEIVQPAAEGKGIGLQIDIPPRLPLVNLDGDMIRRVIINLLDNAIKYTPEGGTVTIMARSNPKEVVVSVRDTGPGIPSDQHTHIFAKFARLQRESAPKGMGLGLTFCKLAVETHGGRIWVESQVGRGSIFSFRLPM
jgi:NtrC-family two-component system sensor histidine kinase KinB